MKTDKRLQDYLGWQETDRSISGRINALIKDIQRNGLTTGIGKPEKLKGRPESRRINDEHRLLYVLDENGNLFIVSCKGRYEDK